MHYCCSTMLTASAQQSSTQRSFSKAAVFGGAAFWQFSVELRFGEGSLPGEAMSSSPAMNCAHSRLAEGQQNSRLRAQTLLTFSHSPCSFRWSLQGLLRKTLPQAETPPQKAAPQKTAKKAALPKTVALLNDCGVVECCDAAVNVVEQQ